MDIKLKREPMVYYSPVYTNLTSREDTTETVVPDTMPDIARILDADAAVYMRGRTVSDGKVLLEGEIHGTVLYLGEEDGRIQKLEMRMPCSFTAEDERIESGDRLMAEMRLQSADARASNPRKVALRAETAIRVAVYRETTMEIPTGAEEGDLQTLMQERRIGYIAAVENKSFVVSEELALPAARPALTKLLQYRTAVSVEDQKPVGGKMILQGTVQLEIQFLGEDENDPLMERFSVPFSQIMDIPDGVEGTAAVILSPDACYVEPMPGAYGSGSLHMETHLLAQTLFRAEREIQYMADAYSVRCACAIKTDTVHLSGVSRPVTLRETLRETLETADTPSEALYGYTSAAIPEVTEDSVRVPVTVHAFYRTERGQISAVTRRMDVEMRTDTAGERSLTLDPPVCGEPYLSVSGGAMELRLPVEVRAELAETEAVEFISAVDLDPEQPAAAANAPSLTLVRMGEQSFWTLAKKYGSTPELVASANPAANAGDLLLIPRAR